MKENRTPSTIPGADKTEEMMNYALLHLQESPSASEIAAVFGYSEKYVTSVFTKVYGFSYGRLVRMFQMREIARNLRYEGQSAKKIAERYGFKDYSNFKRAFKREIGVTPREFAGGSADIPDMPLPKTVNGHKLSFEYRYIDDQVVYGCPIKMEKGDNTDILKECSYVLEHPADDFDPDDPREQIGFWWSEVRNEMYYVYGFREKSITDIPEKARAFDFPAYDYAVFSVERGKSIEDTLKTQRMLVKYVMTVWRELNHKVSTTMVYTYEIFGPDYTRIYLPIVEDKPDHTEDRETIRSWTAYIHDHITEDMSLRGIAEHFNYSEQHFHREFKKHVKMSPSEYIVKCRLYLAAKQIREESGNNTEHIARHFRFKTMRSFKRQFMEEFHVEPEAYHDIPVNMIHLTQYYPETNPEVRFTYDNEPELKVLGKILYTYDKGEMIKEPDIPHLNAYWMQHEYDELRGTIYKCSKDEGDKIAFWNNDNTEERSFFLGPVIDQLADIPEGFRVIHIKPGKYAIFESLLNSDNESLSEVYTLLVRNGIEKWARDNEYQTEKAGRAFIRYKGNKLYLYIPVNG